MKNLFVCSFFGVVLLFTINEFNKDRFVVTNFFSKGKTIVLNPLDAILGEKLLDDGSLRKDNFQSILQLKASCLKDSSGLYAIKEMTKDVFLLTRKKFFNNNKGYSLFVKTKGDRIVFYHAVKDFLIKGALYSENRIYFIGNDYTGITSQSQSSYAVKINCVDLSFKEEWSVVSKLNRSYFFFANGLQHKDNLLIAGIVIQNSGGSSMCVDYYDLFLSKKGKLIHSVFLGTDACTGRNVPDLAEISTLFESS